jgi:hypothetical protein
MRSYKKVRQDIFSEAGLDPKWVDKMEEYRKMSKQGWTRLMDKMRNEVCLLVHPRGGDVVYLCLRYSDS